jgi:hypothetical protein
MQALTRWELLEVVGLSEASFDIRRHRGELALAFGATHPSTPGHYLDLDAVALAITLGLGEKASSIATRVVLNFFGRWLHATARAEADSSKDYFLAVGAFGIKDLAKRIPEVYGVSNGLPAEIQADFEAYGKLVAEVRVNISFIVRSLHERAFEAGINLSAPFFFLPEDARFHEIERAVLRERDARVAKALKSKKRPKTKTLGRHPIIENVSRAAPAYPELTA